MKRIIFSVFTIALVLCGCSATAQYEPEEFVNISDKIYEPVMEIYYQYPEYPAGCELASCCQLLRYYGYNIDIDDLLYTYLPVSNSEWVNSYYGDIYTGGFAFPQAIHKALQDYLTDNNSHLRVENISKCSWEEYLGYLQREIPVITWYTIDYEEPNLSDETMGGYQVWWNLHCIVTYKIDDKYIYIADPIEGYTVQDIEYFKTIWEKCGSYAVTIVP